MEQIRVREDVLGCRVDAVGWDQAVQTTLHWAGAHESRYVCHCNVHAVVTARGDARLHRALNDADLVTPDGMPVAWWLRGLGYGRQPRVDGPDMMWKLCGAAAREGRKIYLYGGNADTLARLQQRLVAAFPNLSIAGAESPSVVECIERVDTSMADRVNESGAQILFVGLGCPKQEHWMRLHRGRVRAVMLGVGAAFDYHAGTVRRAPPWLRRLGLEWLHRLMSEPRRLWRRYAVTNSLFILYATADLLRRIAPPRSLRRRSAKHEQPLIEGDHPMLTPVILSGGAGTRLWPVSRETEPKPFIRLYDGQTLLQKTLARAAAIDGVQRVVTVTTQELYHRTRDEYGAANVQAAPQHDYLLEPCARNTAAAVAVAALHLADTGAADAPMLVMPADHVIQDLDRFRAAIGAAAALAAQDCLVTFGIRPTAPETGYGYIECGAPRARKTFPGDGQPPSGPAAFRVRAFTEKPDRATAERFVRGRKHFWNAGIFCFRARTYLEALRRHAPDVHRAALTCWQHSKSDEAPVRLDPTTFAAIRDVSIDYAVMERHDDIAVVACEFAWSDVGTWDAMSELVPADATGNRVEGEALLLDAANCFVHSKTRLAAVVGVDDLIVVDTADALLVAARDSVHDVKEVVRRLKSSGNGLCREHRTVIRPWGEFTTLEEGNYFKVKRLVVKPGASLSLQRHHHRSEHWVVVQGAAKIVAGNDERLLLPNQSTHIPAGAVHQLSNPGVVDLVVIEVQNGQYLGEDDIVRLDDRYGRLTSTVEAR